MSALADQEKLISALCDSRRYPHPAQSVQVIETHISWVLLAGCYAYKIKKDIDLGFLNYADLKMRRSCCEEEIRLNRRTAPDIYLDVVAIGGSPDDPKFNVQPAIEYAVRMHRFASDNLMDRLLMCGKLTSRHIDTLAATIAHFHVGLPSVDTGSQHGAPASILKAAKQNFELLQIRMTEEADKENIASSMHATEREFDACKSIFDARRAQGFVRECHGDLHLGNITLIDGVPVPFDCIEFNPALRWIDVMDEIAFAMMDMLHCNHPEFAWRFLNAVLEVGGDYAGTSVLRFYLAYRATVRAKVAAIRSGQRGISKRARLQELEVCRSYLALARQCLAHWQAALIITHGLPGSGKSTFSQFVLEQMGAIRIRSDVERKRLYGLSALQDSHANVGGIYGHDATKRTYARLHELARQVLKAGFTVIVDAAFLQREEREQFRELAQSMSVPFAIASLHASNAELHDRIRQRSNDASEADVGVLEKLQQVQQPLSSDESKFAVNFTTEQAPNSKANSQNWSQLKRMLAPL